MATASIDVAYSRELVQSVLAAVTAKAKEHDELAADKLRVDIELENAVRSSETRIEGLRSTIEKSQRTVEDVRVQLKEAENTNSALQNELQALQSSSTTSSSEVETLRARIATLESSNRDTLVVLESKATANDNLSQELQKQHQKGLELSQQVAVLQQNLQNAESAASSAKFREQNLKQEIDLAKRNNEWLDNELKTKSSEALKFRKEKGAKIAELQRSYEESNSNVEALTRSTQALRARLDELQKKAEDYRTRIQQLEEDSAKAQESFKQELETSKRLVEVELEKVKDEAAEEVGHSRQEAEKDRQAREQEEHRVAELEAEVDRLEALIASQAHGGSVPGTPRRGLNGSVLGRAGSPAQFGTPGSSRSKSVITTTQALEELYKVKGQLATERRARSRLEAELDEVMQSAEAKQPEIEEVQAENERLQQEVVEMSKSVDQIGKERDRTKRDARKSESEASTARAEVVILTKSVHDLGAQIKALLFEVEARDKGMDALTSSQRERMLSIARGDLNLEELEGMTDTDRFISERLVIFRNVNDLVEKNQELLKITRQLGAQMESEEALAAKHQAAKDHEQVKSLQLKIENYKDELQATLTRSESYVKERDMFRRMAQHRGQLPVDSDLASMFGQSVDGNQNGVMPTIEQNSNPAMLRELQAQFDQYREEQLIDRRTMKEQTEKLSLEKGALQAEISKISSQLTLANDRYEMMLANYKMLQNENTELQKRSQVLSEAAAKQDIRTQQVAEDLVEARGMVESMRNETANLKAEKKLWKEIQDRKTLQNERELSESETRRRLQSQVESLEAELSTTKRKLNDEIEDSKKAQLRKEYDAQQNQKRIDDLATSLSQAREELVAAKTTRDHLQSRNDELIIELRSAEERVELLQPRPTPRVGINGDTTVEVSDSDLLNREQELALEISELKRNLDLSRSELESAKSQMEQYKSISQASEEELQSINETQDQYREEMDRIIEGKEAKIRELQQRTDDILTELTTTNNELTKLRNDQSEVARQVEEEKAILVAEVARLKDEGERHATAAQFHQQDLRAQAAIATKAQQDYENELVKHAEAAKSLQMLRVEYNQLKTVTATFRAEAESARVTLSQNESSWEDRRKQLEQELNESRSRRDGVNAQNKLLHEQLERVGAQILELQQNRASNIDTVDGISTIIEPTQDRNADGLRELNSYLRREKEILEVQYDLKLQESKRLQQQLDYTQTQLREAREKLDEERRLHADGPRSSNAQKDLMEKLNELNLFRESNITLRNEASQAQAQLVEKTKRVEELTEQIQPLETRIRELEHVKETTDGEMRLLQEDRDRWQKRTQDIISKYDRNRQKLIEQAKERNRQNSKQIQERTSERDVANQEKEALQQQLTSLQQDLESAVQEKNSAEQQLATLTQQVEILTTQRDEALANVSQPAALQAPPDQAETQASGVLDQQLVDLRLQLDVVTRERQSLEVQLADIRTQLELSNRERDVALAEAAEAQSRQPPETAANPTENTHEEGQIGETSTTAVPIEERKILEDRIAVAEAKAKEAEEKAARIDEQIENTVKNRSEKMKTALNKKLAESREKMKAELEAEYKLKMEQEKQIILEEAKTLNMSSAESTNPPTAAEDVPPATPSSLGQKPALTSEQEKVLAEKLSEAQQKAQVAQDNAVAMMEKKMALKTNMSLNQRNAAVAKWIVVENAARDTPQKPVVESNSSSLPTPKPAEVKPELPSTIPQAVPQAVSNLEAANGATAAATSAIPSWCPSNQFTANSTERGGNQRGRGSLYQARGGAINNRGRGGGAGQPRGGLNPAASQFSPGPQGQKRTREEGPAGVQQNNGAKRPRVVVVVVARGLLFC
ncbi:hypothetical protein B0O99DRAFT_668268 [Bisporella sp. PMI_857]|nr:hypothetical protein B0O99DRAFT_668268 [Bisporella sp. PMI_857]